MSDITPLILKSHAMLASLGFFLLRCAQMIRCLNILWNASCNITKRTSASVRLSIKSLPYLISSPLVQAVGMSSHTSHSPIINIPHSARNSSVAMIRAYCLVMRCSVVSSCPSANTLPPTWYLNRTCSCFEQPKQRT